jgi:hypothetical protein
LITELTKYTSDEFPNFIDCVKTCSREERESHAFTSAVKVCCVRSNYGVVIKEIGIGHVAEEGLCVAKIAAW